MAAPNDPWPVAVLLSLLESAGFGFRVIGTRLAHYEITAHLVEYLKTL